MTKNLGQSVTEFYSEMTYLWDNFFFGDLEWINVTDASQYTAFHDSKRLIQFLTAIRDEFETTQASFFHRSSLSSLESALGEIIS